MNLSRFNALFYSVLVLFVLIGLGMTASAQTPTGSITGLIQDSTQAAISNANVVATNVNTTVTYRATASAGGVYVLPSLPIGKYSLHVSAPGFQASERTGLTVTVDQHAEVDFTLQPGATSQTITVAADVNQIEPDSHSIGTVVDTQKIDQLPLNSRNFTSLAFIVPAVYPPVFNSSLGYRGGFNVAGASESSNTSTFDGFDNNNDQQSIPSYQPSVDTIAEFKVLTSLYDAEYGRNYGGQLVVTGKSGTNVFHGTLYEYLRNQIFDAKNYFTGAGIKPYYKRNQFGATLGGPIRRDKTFFFFGYEGLRDSDQVIALATVPLPQWLTGDLSSLLPKVQLKNPFVAGNPTITNNNLASLPQWTAQPAVVGQALAAYYRAPTLATASGTVPANNYNFTGARTETANQWSLRVDETFSTKDSMYGEYNFYQDTSVEPSNTLCGSRVLPGFGCFSDRPLSIAGGSETHVFRPNLLNTARLGFNRYEQNRLQQDDNINFVGKYGLTGVFSQNLATNLGVPATSVTSFSTVGGPNNIPQDFVNNTYNLADQLIYIRGAHSMKVGFDYRRIQQNSLSISNGRGLFTFSQSSSAPTTGFAFADLLLGYPTSTTNNPLAPKIYVRTSEYATYFQDDWKFSTRLTLNLGVRWELPTPFISANNQLSNFNTATGALIGPAVNSSSPRNIIPYDYKMFMPRVGFSFSADAKTVMRGGYGIYSGLLPTFSPIGNLYYNPPMRNPQTFQSSTTVSNALTLANPFPANAPPGTATITAIQSNFTTPYMQEFSLGIQRQLTTNTLLDVSYYGSKGTHLQTQTNLNQPPPSTLATAAAVNATRPFPVYGSIVQYQSTAASNYNSLEVKVDKRLSNGLNGLLSYTYAKSLDDALGVNPQNARNVAAEYGNSSFDARHRLVISGLYQLPFGDKGLWLKSGPASWVAGGWALSGIFTTQTGRFLTPIYSANVSNTFNSQDRPNLIGDPNAGPKTIVQWFNTAAFSKPATGTFGNAGRDIIRVPGYTNVDSTLSRSFPLPRESNLQFRAEFFNIMNHPQFDPPNVTADSASFGKISSAESPRQIQFALRITY